MSDRVRSALGWLVVVAWLAWLGANAALLASDGILRVVGWLFVTALVPFTAPLVVVPALGVALWRRRVGLRTGILLGTGLLAGLPALVGLGVWPIAYPFASLDSTGPSVAVRVPTDRPMRVVWGGDSLERNYHAADPAQRWAYDLVIEPAGHGASSNAEYGCYGADVLAPASGVVTLAVDGHPDGDPANYVPNVEAPAGNHVGLRLDSTGTYLVVAHLRPGSLAVAVGERVEEGKVLGQCGNSGNSSEPHVHLHHQRQDPAVMGLLAEGLPLTFRDLRGGGAPRMPVGGVEVEGERARFVGDVIEATGG